MSCTRKSTAKYTSRPGPPYPANECCGLQRMGNDGKLYKSEMTRSGSCVWKKKAASRSKSVRRKTYKKSKSRSKSPKRKVAKGKKSSSRSKIKQVRFACRKGYCYLTK